MVLKEVGSSGIYLKAISNKVAIYTAYMIVVIVACARLSEYLRRRENKTCMEPLPTRIFCISHAVTIFAHYYKLLEPVAGYSCSGSSRGNVRFIDSETWNTYMSVIVIFFLATVWNHKREDIDILENNCCKWYCFFLSLPASLFFVSDTVEQRFLASCKFVQDSLGFWIPLCGFQIPNTCGRFRILCQRNLDSGFKIVGESLDSLGWIADAVKSQDFGFHEKKCPVFRNPHSLANGEILIYSNFFTSANFSLFPYW